MGARVSRNPQRCLIEVQHRVHFLAVLGVHASQPDDLTHDLRVIPLALGFGVDIADVVGEALYRAAKALTDPILGAVRAADSEEELRALLNAAPGDPAAMSQAIENAGVATRLEEEN